MDNILNTDNLSIQPDNGKLQKPMTNHSFKKEELDWPTIYKLLAQTSERKLEKMCKEETIKDLPKRCPKRYNDNKHICYVCIKGSTTSISKGVIANIDNLRPG